MTTPADSAIRRGPPPPSRRMVSGTPAAPVGRESSMKGRTPERAEQAPRGEWIGRVYGADRPPGLSGRVFRVAMRGPGALQGARLPGMPELHHPPERVSQRVEQQ